jgi:L-rhamnose mutarotase
VHNYSIFFDEETHTLFGYVEIESEEKWNAIANTEICKKWWDFMADCMETNPDNSPKSSNLEEVFHIN